MIHVTRDVTHVACSAIIHTQNVTFTKYPGQNIRQTCKRCLAMLLLYIIRKKMCLQDHLYFSSTYKDTKYKLALKQVGST